jgi:5-methylthioribose kinase
MPITTDEEVLRYMEERGIHATSVQKLTGGSANFVWRAQLKEKRANLGDRPTMVIKHAEPFVAFDINLRLDAVRMNYEIAAMQTAADPVISCPKVGVPSVYSYDDQNKVVWISPHPLSFHMKLDHCWVSLLVACIPLAKLNVAICKASLTIQRASTYVNLTSTIESRAL